MSIFWVRVVFEIRVASYGSQTHIAVSFVIRHPFVRTSTHKLKTTDRYVDVLRIEWLLYYWRHFLCGWSCMRDPNGELRLQTSIAVVLWYSVVAHAYTVSPYLVRNYAWQRNSRSLWLSCPKLILIYIWFRERTEILTNWRRCNKQVSIDWQTDQGRFYCQRGIVL